MLLLTKIKNNIRIWFEYNSIFGSVWNEYNNPWYYWWKSRKYFKRPKAHLVKGEYGGYFGLPCRTDSYHIGPNFFIRGLGWKSKFDSPRYEFDPIICVVWVNPWKTWIDNKFSKETNSKGEKGFYQNKQYWLGLVFNWIKVPDENRDSHTASMATWEAMLDHVIWGHDIKWCYEHNIWSSGIGDNAHKITIEKNIKWKPTLKE